MGLYDKFPKLGTPFDMALQYTEDNKISTE